MIGILGVPTFATLLFTVRMLLFAGAGVRAVSLIFGAGTTGFGVMFS